MQFQLVQFPLSQVMSCPFVMGLHPYTSVTQHGTGWLQEKDRDIDDWLYATGKENACPLHVEHGERRRPYWIQESERMHTYRMQAAETRHNSSSD